jgi:RNA polymerase sigma-70 factor (ECF subfamily)
MSQALTLSAGADLDADLNLVIEAKERPEAFSALYERYFARVYRYLAARAATAEEAADLTQAVFLKAFDALPRYRIGSAPFAAWLFRIARNAATDASRRHRPVVGIERAAAVSLPEDRGPEASLLRQERIGRLRELLTELEPTRRDLLALRFGGGLSSREIAVIVGKTEASVKKQITRTIAKLKESYNDDLD